MSTLIPSTPQHPCRQDHFEKLRRALKIDQPTWLEILNIQETDYQAVVKNQKRADERLLLSFEEAVGVSANVLLSGQLNFSEVTKRLLGEDGVLLPKYSSAAFGRFRTTVTLLDYVEEFYGWQRRYEIMDHFYLNEAMIADLSRSVSMNLISDIMTYLRKTTWFKERDFLEAGSYSVVSHQGTQLPELFASTGSPKKMFEKFVQELVLLFEHNLDYSLMRLNDNSCTIQMRTRAVVAEAARVKHVGNGHTCSIRNGVIASIPFYLGLPLAEISETRCVHRGDSNCELQVDFQAAEKRQRKKSLKPLSGVA